LPPGDLRGGVFADDGWLHGRYYAANLTPKAQACSDADLARIIRLGVRPDGRGVVVMPSFAYVRLTDAETADLIAFIRSMPVGGADPPSHAIGPLDQWALWRGGPTWPWPRPTTCPGSRACCARASGGTTRTTA
jgi:hypothetical protein